MNTRFLVSCFGFCYLLIFYIIGSLVLRKTPKAKGPLYWFLFAYSSSTFPAWLDLFRHSSRSPCQKIGKIIFLKIKDQNPYLTKINSLSSLASCKINFELFFCWKINLLMIFVKLLKKKIIGISNRTASFFRPYSSQIKCKLYPVHIPVKRWVFCTAYAKKNFFWKFVHQAVYTMVYKWQSCSQIICWKKHFR